MKPEVASITARWCELVAHFGADEARRSKALEVLIVAYTGTGRHYHDLRHIDALLEFSRAHRIALTDPAALDLALFYHDAVYEPSRSDNEAASAALAAEWLRRLGAGDDLIGKVCRYIDATKHVGGVPKVGEADPDLDHLLDFDLSVLAAEPVIYDANAVAIRREYSMYPDLLYRRGRAGVLAKLLALPSLYRTPALKVQWETRARANLARELAELQ